MVGCGLNFGKPLSILRIVFTVSHLLISFPSFKEADESLNFEEQILEAAKAITAATVALVKSASAAQRELVASGRVSHLKTRLCFINKKLKVCFPASRGSFPGVR